LILRSAGRLDGIERTLIRQIFESAPPDAINLGLGQPDLPTPAPVALAGVEAIAAGRTGYSSTAGDPALRAAIADRYRPLTDGPEDVLVTIGSQEAMFVCCLALADAGDEILYPDPGYPAYPVVARLIGARPVAYPVRAERGFRLDPVDVESRLTERTRAVILCHPSNPTGACMHRTDLTRLVELLEQRGVPWISDEIYAGLSYDGRFVSPAELAPRGGLVVSGLSKDLCMTGWRIGWVAGPREFVGRLTAVHQFVVTCASSVSQAAAVAAFSPAGRTALERHRRIFERRRSLMAEELAEIPHLRFEPPDGAFYYYVDVSAHGSSLALARRLLERGNVLTIPGEAFGERGAGYLRISFAATEAAIRTGLYRMRRELGAARS
jgi:aspartate aminotransferase